MNIRIPDTLPTMSAAAQTWPDRIRRTSSRTRLVGGIAAVAVAAFVAWRIFGGPTVHERPPPPVQVARV
jgi:hypothetical protein